MAPSPLKSPGAELLEECLRYLDVQEDPPGSNRGVEVDYWLRAVGCPLKNPWCAAFICQCGVQALGRKHFPFKRSALVQDMVNAAKAAGRFTKDMASARVGDLLVLYYPTLKRYGHIAVIEKMTKTSVTTIDGNTVGKGAQAGTREGYRVARVTRTLNARMAVLQWPT